MTIVPFSTGAVIFHSITPFRKTPDSMSRAQVVTLTALINTTFRSLNARVAQYKNCSFGVNTTTVLQNITLTSDNNGIQMVMFRLRSVPELSEIIVIFFSSIMVLTPDDNNINSQLDATIIILLIISIISTCFGR